MSHFLDRLTYFRRSREKFSGDHGITTDEPREWERAKALIHQQGARSGPSGRLETLDAMLTLIQALEQEEPRLASRTAKASGLFDADRCTGWARQVARRHGDSKGSIGLLSQACLGNEHLARGVREASEEVQAMAQSALGSSLNGEHERTVADLMAHYSETGNLRFLHLAKASLDKHANAMAVTDCEHWRREIERASGSVTSYVIRSGGSNARTRTAERRADPNLAADVDELLG